MRFTRRRLDGAGYWQVRVDQSSRLLTVLYMRDALGVTQTAAPVGLPRVDPRAGIPADVVESVGDLYTVAWNSWWTRCLAAGNDWAVDVLSPEFIGDVQLAKQVDYLRQRAIIWSQAHQETTRDAIHQECLRHSPIVRAYLSKQGPVALFTLRILVLPVDSSQVWPVGPELVIVPDRLFTAGEAFNPVLFDLIETLRRPA